MREREGRHDERLAEDERARVDDEERAFARCMEHVRANAAGEVEGLFGPGSLAWAIYAEPVILLGGVAAVLLQVAHPAIASGVEAFSSYEKDLLGRARRTFATMYALAFGDLDEAMGAARMLHRIHARVRGTIDDPSLRAHGRPFRANEQPLLAWVSATTSVCLLGAYEAFARELDAGERARAHRELCLARVATGVLPENVEPTVDAFDAYVARMIEGGELEIGRAARGVASALRSSPLVRGRVEEVVTAGLLPARLRDAYGFAWGPRERATFDRLRGTYRAVTRIARPPYRHVVAWHQAELRIARARGERGSAWARALARLDEVIHLPTGIRRPRRDDARGEEARR